MLRQNDRETIERLLPGWTPRFNSTRMTYSALSPNIAIDGVEIHGATPQQVVTRVRRYVRSTGRAVDMPPSPKKNGTPVKPKNAVEATAPSPVEAPGKNPPPVNSAQEITPELARQAGFEGEACRECSRWMMVRNGNCLKCTACGATTSCS